MSFGSKLKSILARKR
jgi:hypothetical protein